MYKLPKQAQKIDDTNQENMNPFIAQGTAYTYISNKMQTNWKFSDLSFNVRKKIEKKNFKIVKKCHSLSFLRIQIRSVQKL